MRFRVFWLLLGLTATACGMAGVILPLVPATPFLLVAAYAFARSSPRLQVWLLSHPRLGRLTRDWQQHRSIDSRAKAVSVWMMGGTLAMSWILGVSNIILAVQAVVLGAAALFVLTRPSTPEV